MSPLHHLLIAWLIANLVETDVRTRFFALLAGVISDIDGFPVLFNTELFLTYHHTFAHTLIFGIAVSAVLTVFIKRKMLGFSILMLAFVAHLGCDIVGSWGVPVFAPFIPTSFSTSSLIPNDVTNGVIYPVVLVLALLGSLAVLILRRRTPMEFFSKKWDGILVDFLTLPFTRRCYVCGKRAFFKCESCLRTACGSHVAKETKRISCVECRGEPR